MPSSDPPRRPSAAGGLRADATTLGAGFLLHCALACWLGAPSSAEASNDDRPHPAVVRVLVSEPSGSSFGSGTLVARSDTYGVVVTNWHVVRDASGPISVLFPDGFHSPASVFKADANWDLAALITQRPHAPPVLISTMPPRPGDVLTIAGYGTGRYRAAAGRCTQYVSPGANFPYEIVELSTVARQGDSGGPIFDDHGQLAGVLFGSDGGSTSGSYGGRVRQFLATVVPDLNRPDTTMVATQGPATQRPLQPITAWSPAAEPTADVSAGQLANIARPPAATDNGAAIPLPSKPVAMPQRGSAEASPSHKPPATDMEAGANPSRAIPWDDLIGHSPLDKVKTVLAAIGLISLLMWALRPAAGK